MKIGIVSDVHGNLHGFEAVLADVESVQPDLVVHGGDLVLGLPGAPMVVDRIRELGWPGVLGNTDQALWDLPEWLPEQARAAFERRIHAAVELIGQDRVDWLRKLPLEYRWGPLALTHAAPGNLWDMVPKDADDERMREVFGRLQAPLAVYCHIHTPFVRDVGGFTVANTGSAGMPFDGDVRASWLLVIDGRAEVRRVEYDVEAAVDELLHSGLPDAEVIAESVRTATFIPPGSR
ncbi:MAG TPA: metallophosphoesterase family protein [Candidatus Dormibacteraeota bacterium]